MVNTDTQTAEISQEILAQLPSLMAVASRLTKNRAEAEDLVQDTCVKALRAWRQYEQGSNLRAWCLKILKNTFINRYRREGLARSMMEHPESDPISEGWIGGSSLVQSRDPERAAMRPLLRDELCRALDAIPEEFRIVVLLADVEELSYREIADTLGCPIGTVMSRLHRGRKQLKEHLSASLPLPAAQMRQLGLSSFAVQHSASSAVDSQVTSDDKNAAAVDLTAFRQRKQGAL